MPVRKRKWTGHDGRVEERWMVDVHITLPNGNRQRVRDFSPVNTRRGAEQYEAIVRQAILNGTYTKEAIPQKAVPAFNAFVETFLVDAKNNNKPSTVESKRQNLDLHLLPFFGRMKLNEIQLGDIERFKAHMRAKRSESRKRKEDASKYAVNKRYGGGPSLLSDKSINNVLGILSKFLNLAVEHGVIPHAPRVKRFRDTGFKLDFLSFEETERMLEVIEPEWRTALLLGIHAGLRIGEIIGLQWDDIDFNQGKLAVRRTIWRNQMGTPKSGRMRFIPLTRTLASALKEARHLRGKFVLCDSSGNPFKPGALKWPLKRALLGAKVIRPDGVSITWHTLRHTYASHLAMKGVSVRTIQELLGHASIEMTMRYAHLSPESKMTAVSVLDEPTSRPVGTRLAQNDVWGPQLALNN